MNGKNNLSQRDMIRQIYTVLLGVPNTDDRGLVGKVKSHDIQLASVSRRTWITMGVLIALGALVSKLGSGLW